MYKPDKASVGTFLTQFNGVNTPFLVVKVQDGEGIKLAKAVEYDQFFERLGQTNAEMDQRYGVYDSNSTFYLILDVAQSSVAGSLRVINPNRDGWLKCFGDFTRSTQEGGWGKDIVHVFQSIGGDYQTDISLCREIATVSVYPEYASAGSLSGVSIGLYAACFMDAIQQHIKYLFAIQELKPLANLQQFGEPFSRLPGFEDKPHEGDTLNAATYLHVEQTRQKLYSISPDLARLLSEGVGLEATHTFLLEGHTSR